MTGKVILSMISGIFLNDEWYQCKGSHVSAILGVIGRVGTQSEG